MSHVIEIDNLEDDRLVAYWDLRDADLRGARRLFTVESTRVIRRFLASSWPVESLLLEPHAFDALREELSTLEEGIPIYRAPADSLETISGYGFHRGALALGRREQMPQGIASLGNTLEKESCTILAAEGVVHVDNMGGLFRNAACLGADGVMLSPACADPLFRKTVRISTGRVFTIPWTRCESWPDSLIELREEHGFRIVALETGADAISLEQLALEPRMLMLVGAEGRGLAPATLAACDQVLEIPSSADAEDETSVNVAVASAIGLYELGRRRRAHDLDQRRFGSA